MRAGIPISFLLATAGMALVSPVSALAQGVSPILACTAIPEGSARLACFDREASVLKGSLASGEVSVVERKELQVSERAAFGFPSAAAAAAVLAPPVVAPAPAATAPARPTDSLEAAPQAQAAAAAPPPVEPLESIQVKVTEVIPTAAGLFVLQMDDQSIWRTTDTHRSFYPKIGQDMTISKASLGSYLMKTDKSRPVRARRMR